MTEGALTFIVCDCDSYRYFAGGGGDWKRET